jgi:LmbE family N-acetylglucosaminyl deacetylase
MRRATELIRRCRPRTVAVPYWQDRHPDHAAASVMLREAVFNARLHRYPVAGEPWSAEWVCFYFINDAAPPSFVVDVSAHYDTKRQALACYRSQFAAGTGSVATRLHSPRFAQLIESRDAQFGALAGVAFAEGFVVNEPVARGTLFKESAS